MARIWCQWKFYYVTVTYDCANSGRYVYKAILVLCQQYVRCCKKKLKVHYEITKLWSYEMLTWKCPTSGNWSLRRCCLGFHARCRCTWTAFPCGKLCRAWLTRRRRFCHCLATSRGLSPQWLFLSSENGHEVFDSIFEARRCHSKVRCCNKWLRRMVYNAAARCELIRRYYSGVVSRLCIRSLHAVVTVLFYARLNTH